jgi:hypothetical protein
MIRRTTGLVRVALAVGVVLTFVAGVQLFVLTDRTGEYFAWTIGVGASATLLGAFYWSASIMAYLSLRRREWARARVGLPGVTVFLWATLAVTLLHLDAFHLGSGPVTARVAAWGWLVAYTVDPVLVTAALLRQRRARGEDPPRSRPLVRGISLALWSSGALVAALGILLIAAPATAAGMWPWPLTALTSRACGAWILAVGCLLATMAWEDDADRLHPAVAAFAVLGPLLVLGAIRYRADFGGSGALAVYLGVVAAVTVVGIIGGVGRGAAGRRPSYED